MSEVRSKAKGVGRKGTMFIGSLVLVLVFCIELREASGDDRPTNPGFRSSTLELLSYQDSGYRFQIIGLNETPPSGFEQPDFDDTNFRTETAAFGAGGGGLGDEDCPLRETVQTRWRLNSQLLVRRVVSIPDGANNVRILASFDNDLVGVFFNGTQLNTETIIHPNCPIPDEFRFDVPEKLIDREHPGQNLVAFHLRDQGVESFFDVRILAEIPTKALRKITDGLQILVAEQLPSVSISALSISECEPPTSDNARGRILVEATVDSTGQRAQMIVSVGPKPRAVSVENMVDGQTMSTTTQTPGRALVTVMPGTEPSNRRELVNVSAFPTVLQQPRVISEMVECFAATDHIVRPPAPCQENVDIAEANCQQACRAEVAVISLCTHPDCAFVRDYIYTGVESCIRNCVRAAATLRRNCPP